MKNCSSENQKFVIIWDKSKEKSYLAQLKKRMSHMEKYYLVLKIKNKKT